MPTFQTPGFMCRSVMRCDQVRFTVTCRTLLVGQKEVFNERRTLVSENDHLSPGVCNRFVLLILYESAFLSFPTCCDLPCSRCTVPVQFSNYGVILCVLVCPEPGVPS